MSEEMVKMEEDSDTRENKAIPLSSRARGGTEPSQAWLLTSALPYGGQPQLLSTGNSYQALNNSFERPDEDTP